MHDGRKNHLMAQWAKWHADVNAFKESTNPSNPSEKPKYKSDPWKKSREEIGRLEARINRLIDINKNLKVKMSNLEETEEDRVHLSDVNNDLYEKIDELEMNLRDEQDFKDRLYKQIEVLKQNQAELESDYHTSKRDCEEYEKDAKRIKTSHEVELQHLQQQCDLKVASAKMQGTLETLQRRRSDSASPSQTLQVPVVD